MRSQFPQQVYRPEDLQRLLEGRPPPTRMGPASAPATPRIDRGQQHARLVTAEHHDEAQHHHRTVITHGKDDAANGIMAMVSPGFCFSTLHRVGQNAHARFFRPRH